MSHATDAKTGQPAQAMGAEAHEHEKRGMAHADPRRAHDTHAESIAVKASRARPQARDLPLEVDDLSPGDTVYYIDHEAHVVKGVVARPALPSPATLLGGTGAAHGAHAREPMYEVINLSVGPGQPPTSRTLLRHQLHRNAGNARKGISAAVTSPGAAAESVAAGAAGTAPAIPPAPYILSSTESMGKDAPLESQRKAPRRK
jgi:hypothetical protein